jgi:hypothetical protein
MYGEVDIPRRLQVFFRSTREALLREEARRITATHDEEQQVWFYNILFKFALDKLLRSCTEAGPGDARGGGKATTGAPKEAAYATNPTDTEPAAWWTDVLKRL